MCHSTITQLAPFSATQRRKTPETTLVEHDVHHVAAARRNEQGLSQSPRCSEVSGERSVLAIRILTD